MPWVRQDLAELGYSEEQAVRLIRMNEQVERLMGVDSVFQVGDVVDLKPGCWIEIDGVPVTIQGSTMAGSGWNIVAVKDNRYLVTTDAITGWVSADAVVARKEPLPVSEQDTLRLRIRTCLENATTAFESGNLKDTGHWIKQADYLHSKLLSARFMADQDMNQL